MKIEGIREVRITTMEELGELLYDHPFDKKIGRNRDLYVYRGLPDVNYKLVTTLQRCCKSKKKEIEKSLYDNFAKYAELEDATIRNSVWRCMILGQHHGLPTRLLDWSKSPLIALHFATTEDDMDNLDRRDCVVWRLDVEKLHAKLPYKYLTEMEQAGQHIFSVDMLQATCDNLNGYDADMGNKYMVIMEPPTMDERMMNQYSFFSVVPSDVNQVEEILEHNTDAVVKYVISKNLRWEIRDFLDQANVSERIVYPGLGGIAAWIRRHYFVRQMGRLHVEKINIAALDADVIVNSTDSYYHKGAISKAIFAEAGEELSAAVRQLEACSVGDFVATDGYELKAKKILHANAPEGKTENRQTSDEQLAGIYRKCLDYVVGHQYHSIGFPVLATGYKGYYREVAWRIALSTCNAFLECHEGYPLDITICVISEDDYVFGQSMYNEMMHIDVQVPKVSDVRVNPSRRERNGRIEKEML